MKHLSWIAIAVLVVLILFNSLPQFDLKPKPEKIVIIDTVLVDKIDTVITKKIEYNTIYQTRRDTIFKTREVSPIGVLSDIETIETVIDSFLYSWAEFDTEFEAIKIGAYAKANVDSFTFENFPKPVISSDTLLFKKKFPWKTMVVSAVVGAISWEVIR